ncbi:MAG: hypothetical protein QOI04_842 [Verrucomicrobiota bacterium]|jgi:CheY-like chemotaxis protein
MQLLIVHRDAEFGNQLVQMVKDYTTHECALVSSEAAALVWAQQHARCSLLLTQIAAGGIDGFAVAGALSELFPSLQTMFLPSYAAAEQRLEVTHPKVFPEPIDGEQLLQAIARADNAPADSRDLFHVVDVLQMCCLSRKNGAVQVVKDRKTGLVFLRDGKIVQAEFGVERGAQALLEIVELEFVEFAYDESVRPDFESVSAPWDKTLIEAVVRDKEQKTTATSWWRQKRA